MTSLIKAKIDNLIGIHSRDGYHTAALLTPDDLAEIRDRIAAAEADQFDALRAAYVRGADWAYENGPGCKEYRHKAAYDYADKATAPADPVTSG